MMQIDQTETLENRLRYVWLCSLVLNSVMYVNVYRKMGIASRLRPYILILQNLANLQAEVLVALASRSLEKAEALMGCKSGCLEEQLHRRRKVLPVSLEALADSSPFHFLC